MSIKVPPEELIANYTRLLTADPSSCAELFSDDAVYVTKVGPKKVRLEGRHQILDFISKAPGQMTFSLKDVAKSGTSYIANIAIHSPRLGELVDQVKFRVKGGRIARFEVLHN